MDRYLFERQGKITPKLHTESRAQRMKDATNRVPWRFRPKVLKVVAIHCITQDGQHRIIKPEDLLPPRIQEQYAS